MDQAQPLGYVLDVGPRFFLIGFIDDGIRLNGFQCHRISDVRRLQVPDPQAKFIAEALRIRDQGLTEKPDIHLSSLPELLKSASRLFLLVAIHRERVNPDTCKIGRVIDVTLNQLHLLEIDPDAVWEEEPIVLRLSEITRVEFGGSYEDALQLVGGVPYDLRPR